jgi:homocysteine S-methyltransferase
MICWALETNGRLPTGQHLFDAIAEVDAATGKGPVYYMINCAHPTHFSAVLANEGSRVARVRGLRANASKRSHQELNDASELDDGDPLELGEEHGQLVRDHPHINVLGGCCGTDHRHVECISLAAERYAGLRM